RRARAFPLAVKVKSEKLLALGSILHFANSGDMVWGTGVNGKIANEHFRFDKLDIRMVRGPLTGEFLVNRGLWVPEDVYGDPALLLPYLFPKLKPIPVIGRVTVLPNFNELSTVKPIVPQGYNLISPLGYWKHVVNEILHSELVLTSSLHGLIISEAFGVPVRLFAPCGGETLFK